MVTVVKHSDWSSKTCTCTRTASFSKGAVYHYFGDNLAGSDHQDCINALRGAERYHMDGKGFCCIAYNEAFCIHGVVFTCRGELRSAAQDEAAIAGDENDEYRAFVFIAGPDTPLTDRAKLAARWLWDNKRHGPEALGHRDIGQTNCPGNKLYEWVKSPTGLLAPLEDDMTPEECRTVVRQELAAYRDDLAREVWTFLIKDPDRDNEIGYLGSPAQSHLRWANKSAGDASDKMDDIDLNVWNYLIKDPARDGEEGYSGSPAFSHLRWANRRSTDALVLLNLIAEKLGIELP